jgi:hypothetical protein
VGIFRHSRNLGTPAGVYKNEKCFKIAAQKNKYFQDKYLKNSSLCSKNKMRNEAIMKLDGCQFK